MGFLRWLRRGRSKGPRPPWVRPEFVGVLALVAMAGIGIGSWATSDEGSPAPVAQRHQEYVGLQAEDLVDPRSLPCDPECYVEWLWQAWLQDHPDAQVLSRTPVYGDGVLLGYEVVYRTV